MAILPMRNDDPRSSAPVAPTANDPASEIIRFAEMLGIPWKCALLGEIEAERRLRRYLAEIEGDWPLSAALTVLPFSFLQSWRVRDRIERLAFKAKGAAVRDAVRQLRIFFQRLTGKGDRDEVAFAEHLWFAYQRVLLLQRVCRAAARSQGTMPERLAFICSRTRCGYDDAAWAVCQEVSPQRGHRFEAAVRKVRGEGFMIPHAETEARALAELRRVIRLCPHLRRRSSPVRSRDLVSLPQRVRLPVNAT